MSNPEIKNVRMRQRADKIYEAVWIENGRPKRRSTGQKLKHAANIAFAQIEADIRAPRVPDAPTIGWLIDAYQASLEATKPAHSMATINASLRPVKARLGDLRWDQLTQQRIDDYAAARLTDKRWADHPGKRKKTDKTIGPSTVDRDLRMLRAALASAHAARLIPTEVKFKINVTPNAPKTVWLSKAEVALLLDAAVDSPFAGRDSRIFMIRGHGPLWQAMRRCRRKPQLLYSLRSLSTSGLQRWSAKDSQNADPAPAVCPGRALHAIPQSA